jgi:hypothetical protein
MKESPSEANSGSASKIPCHLPSPKAHYHIHENTNKNKQQKKTTATTKEIDGMTDL